MIHEWNLFARLAIPEARREAITSRPWLMSSVRRGGAPMLLDAAQITPVREFLLAEG